MKSSLKLLALLFAASFVLNPAHAQDEDDWTGGGTGTATGQWVAGANWSLTTQPTSSDFALIGITATITMPSVSTSILSVDVRNATVSLTATTGGFTTENLYVYDNANLSLSIPTGGQFAVTDEESFVGDGTFGSGTLTVSGSGTLSYSSGFDALYVGGGGQGVMNQLGGTVSISTGTLTIGSDVDFFDATTGAGSGVYNLSGTSTLTVGEMNLGVGSTVSAPVSTGTFNMSGGQVTAGTVALGVNGDIVTDPVNGDTGVFTQSAGNFSVGTLEIGESTGGVGSYSLGGTGTLTAGTLVIGDQAGASGTFTQTDGTGTIGTEMNVGENGTGLYSISGGTLTVADGAALAIGDQVGSSGTVTQSGGAVIAAGSANVNVANSGTGVYTLSGGTLTLTTGSLNVGASAGNGAGNGTFTLSGSGDLIAPGGVLVGGGVGAGAGVFNDSGGTIDPSTIIEANGNGTFNQNVNFTPILSTTSQVILLPNSIYNLNAGTLTIGGDMTAFGFSGIFAFSSATFNFAGGTVLPTGTDWNDVLNGSVTGNSTIDTTTNNAVISGTLTGSGTLTVIGSHTVEIDNGVGNSSGASWSVNVQGGTVDTYANRFPSSGNITIGSSGAFDITTAGTSTLTGTLSGSGAFGVTFGNPTDTLELSAPVNFTGGTTTMSGGGTLQVLNGTLGSIAGADGDSLVIGTASGSGAVSLNGTNSYTGSTTINSGYTLLASNLEGAGGGTITNNGTLGSNATLPTTPGPTLTLGGSLNSSGNLLIRMNNNVPDEIAVNGGADITGSITLVNAGGNFSLPIVTTTTGVTYTGPTTFAANSVTTANITTVGDDLVLTLNTFAITSIPGLNLTPNELAVANALDPLVLSTTQQPNFNTLVNLILPNGTSNAQIAQNLEQLTPQSLQYAQAIAYEHSAFLVSTVDGFDNALHHEFSGFDTSAINFSTPGFDSGLGRQLQSLLAFDPPAFHQAAPNGVNYYPGGESAPTAQTTDSPSSPGPSSQVISDSPEGPAPMPLRTEPHSVTLRKPDSNFSAFVGGNGTIADLNQSQSAPYAPTSKASYTSVDAIGGISYRMTSNLAAGVLFDYSHTDADTDSYGSKTKVDSYSPGVFATYGDKGFYVNGLFSYGYNQYNNQRVIPAVNGTATSNPNGNQYTGALDAGYEFHPAQGWCLTPAGGLTYTHLDIDSFSETGASPANLDVDAQHDDSLRSRLGGYVTYETAIGQLTLLPTFSAMWQHEFLDENAPITSQFNDFSSGAFTINSVSMGRDSALISIGLTAELNNSMAVFIDCMADVNGNYNAENFVGGFKGSF